MLNLCSLCSPKFSRISCERFAVLELDGKDCRKLYRFIHVVLFSVCMYYLYIDSQTLDLSPVGLLLRVP